MSSTNIDAVIYYHEETKHHFHRFARSLGHLDWANQPHPFRYYEGAPRIALPFLSLKEDVPYESLYNHRLGEHHAIDESSIADFLRYSLGLTAWKKYGEDRWSLRANPSSGNLHPTEGYIILPTMPQWSDTPAVCHYDPEKHHLEIRARISDPVSAQLLGKESHSFLIALSSIHWREAWKYGERAFRYCQHDVGHAIAALRFSAALRGWQLKLIPSWPSSRLETLLGLDRIEDFHKNEHEEPDLLALVTDSSEEFELPLPPDESFFDAWRSAKWHGKANRLSKEHMPWPIIETTANALHIPDTQSKIESPWRPPSSPQLLTSYQTGKRAKQIIRQRRSGVDFDPRYTIDLGKFLPIVARTLPNSGSPWDAIYWPACVDLFLFVHRVEGIPSGLYMLVRNPGHEDELRTLCHNEFLWTKPSGIPGDIPLYLLKEKNVQDIACAISCQQSIAGNSFFSLGMLARFAESLKRYGPWFYRSLFWETGMIGQVLYLEAEAHNARGTGIGCFFDDAAHELLGIDDQSYQSLYHFTIGIAIDDPRLSTLPPYAQEPLS